jgi:hypothetical protein
VKLAITDRRDAGLNFDSADATAWLRRPGLPGVRASALVVTAGGVHGGRQ